LKNAFQSRRAFSGVVDVVGVWLVACVEASRVDGRIWKAVTRVGRDSGQADFFSRTGRGAACRWRRDSHVDLVLAGRFCC